MVSQSPAGRSAPRSSFTSSTGHPARDPELAAAERLDQRLVDVELVDDLADKFLDEVLERHDAGRAAVFVDDDSEVELACLHLAHERGDTFRLGDVVRRSAHLAHGAVLLAASNRADQVLGERDPDHVVEALVEHRDAAVAGLDGPFEHRSDFGGVLDRDDVGPGHHHLSHDRVTELDDRVDERPLVTFDRLVLRGDVGERQQLGLGDVRIAVARLARRG